MTATKAMAEMEAMRADIRAKCLDCCAGSRRLVEECRDQACRLWRHRSPALHRQTEKPIDGQIGMFESE